MATELRVKKILIRIYLAIVVFGVSNSAFCQINIQGDKTIDITFSLSHEIDSDYIKRINLINSDVFKGAVNLENVYPLTNTISVDSDTEQSFYTIKSFNDMVSLGFGATPLNEGTFATFSFKNDSEFPIGELTLSFDWFIQSDQSPELKLQYRVNKMEWRDYHKRYFSPPVEGNGDELVSVSMQYSLDQIYIKKGDTIDVRWEWKTDTENSFFALHRIEAKPEVIEKSEKLYPGALIISEILPPVSVTGGVVEYFEVYNATNKTISMKGFEIWVSGRHEVIQEDVRVEPHEFVVLSKTNLRELPFSSEYDYKNISLTDNGGSIKLVYNEVEVSKATYDAVQAKKSWELMNTGDAHDGYASMQVFSTSDSPLNNELHGSPGSVGKTIRVFSNHFENQGWHIVGFPGIAEPELKRGFSGTFLIDDSESDKEYSWVESSITTLKPGQAGLLQAADSENGIYKVMATEIPSVQSFKINEKNAELPFLLIGNPFSKSISMNHIVNSQGISEFAVAQIWDPIKQSFQLVNDSDTEILPWNGFILPKITDEFIEIRETPAPQNASKDPLINFEFTVQTNSDERYYDDATAIKILQSEEIDHQLHRMPKFWPIRLHQENAYKTGLIYLTGLHDKKPMAQTTSTVDGRKEMIFYLNNLNIGNSGSATLAWSFNEWLPDHWIISLTDVVTGMHVDMREEKIYQFQVSESMVRHDFLPQEPGIISIPVVEQEARIKISIHPEPIADLENSETEGERPDVVRLKQNYPNPFNPTTNINFYLPEQSAVKIGIYNVVGQRVAVLLENVLSAGEHSIMWDASEMPSGIYIVQLEAGNRIQTKKMTLVK